MRRAALDDVKASLQTLSAELAKRGQLVEDKAVAREADTQLDRVWSPIDRFLSAWAALDGTELAEAAAALRQRLFPDGLSFLTKSFNAEWAASEQRLAVIDTENHELTFERLGGAPFLASLRRAHKAYGRGARRHRGEGRPAAGAADPRGTRRRARRRSHLRGADRRVGHAEGPGERAARRDAAAADRHLAEEARRRPGRRRRRFLRMLAAQAE